VNRPVAAEDEVALNRAWAEQVFAFSPDGTTVNPAAPFSFVYGGKHSSALIGGWRCEVTSEAIDPTVSRRIVTLTDPLTKLEVKAVCLIYLDTAGVDWTLYFTNYGAQDSPIIEHVLGVDTPITPPPGAQAVLHRLNGAPCQVDDWMPFDQPIPPGQRIEFAATAGRSSNVSPWFNLDFGSGGVITAIGWSGQWAASIDYHAGQLRTQAGLSELHTVLHPGESLRSPRIMQLRWQGGDHYDAYNAFRRTMFAHILPRIDSQVVVPPIVHLSTAFYELNDSNEENVLAHLRAIRGLGFEMFWLDAYWTGPHGFPNSMGSYGFPIERVEPRDRFPHGLQAIGQAVEREGLGFVMWFEPERVVVDTFLAREHPEWVISPAGDGSGLFDLGHLDARRFMTNYLNAAIKAYQLTCLRIDYNIDPLIFWQFRNASDPDRAGLAEMRYVEGLYQMWDDILAANPKLFIDNCATGGRRIDLETMARSIPLWRSDNTCDMLDGKEATVDLAALKNQGMSAGLNRYVPFSLCGQMGATPYLFRSGFNAGIAFAEDVRPAAYPRDQLQQGIAEGKRIRRYFFGDFYPLIEDGVDPQGWCVLQYHLAQAEAGLLMVFRRDQAPEAQRQIRLRQIDSRADYQVSYYYTYALEKQVIVSGVDLQDLTVDIGNRPGSLIIEYAVCR